MKITNFVMDCGMFDKDPLFSTCYDHKVAKILAYDMLEIYLATKITKHVEQASYY